MHDFTFYNPTRVVFGRDTITKIGDEVATCGRKALLVCGKASIKKNGVYDTVVEALTKAGVETIEHSGVQSNPVLSHVRDGCELARKERVDVIVAVGGGSAIDEAKCIAAGALVECDPWGFFTGQATIEKALPILTVATMSATASQMNCGFVVTNEATRQKLGTFAEPT